MRQSLVILTIDLGFGHRSAARALESAIHIMAQDQFDVHIVNPLENPSVPRLIKQIEENYNTVVTESLVL